MRPGPLFYKGLYHFFYQYNLNGAVWGDIAWGHAVSKDLIHWFHFPLAMVPDQWYDANGVWTGSATLLDDGSIVMLYTGSTDNFVQVIILKSSSSFFYSWSSIYNFIRFQYKVLIIFVIFLEKGK